MNFNTIAVYDFETDSPDPYTCNPVQLACIMVNPRTLEIIEGSEFNTRMQPLDINDEGYVAEHKDTIEWHSRISKTSSEEIVEGWKDAPQQQDAFDAFTEYLLRYHKKTGRKSKFSAPIKAGYNIIRFDNVIMERLCKKYHKMDKRNDMSIFHPRDQIDGMMFSFNWFENSNEPESYSMDTLRPYFGMSSEGAHDALQDVKDTANIITRFMKLHRTFGEKVKFKGAFRDVS